MSSKFMSSSPSCPCSICNRTKDGDCRISLDEGLVLCHSEINGRQKGDELNGYIYLGEDSTGNWGKWVKSSEQFRKERTPGQEFRYPFADIEGNVLVHEVRVYQATGNKKTWMEPKGVDTAKLVPYRYLEAIQALKDGASDCFIAEGPPKADCLWELGIPAVAFANGFQAPRDSHWFEGFEDRLIVAADRDKIGLEKAHKVLLAYPLAKLLKPCPESAYWEPEWLEYGGGFDIKDWIEQLKRQGLDSEQIKVTIEKEVIELPRHPERDPAGTAEDEPAPGDGKQTKIQNLLAIASECLPFHTPDQVAYADVWVKNVRQTHPIRRQSFRRWLTSEFYKRHGATVGSEHLQQVIELLDAQACNDHPERPVFLRTAHHEGRIYLDLGDESWRVVEVSPDGWRIVTDAPVRFIRSDAMLPLMTPMTANNAKDLSPFKQFRSLLNLSDNDWQLLLAWILFSLYPHGSKPVLILNGEAGGGKSTLCRWLQALIDPCKGPLLKGVPDARDMAVIASRRWLLTVDNLSHLSNTQSDDLCRLATGGGFLTRKLFTDEELTCIEYRRPCVVNAIDAIATRGDLLDRAIMITLGRIPEDKRLPEAEAESKFNTLQPYLFSCLLDALAAGLKALPTTKLERCPRMADFATFAVAAEQSLRFESGSFLQAYTGAMLTANETAVENSPVASAIERLLEATPGKTYSATPSKLLEAINDKTPSDERGKHWPGTASVLSRQLTRLATILRAVGIGVTVSRSKSNRLVTFEKLGDLPSLPSPTVIQELQDNTDKGFSDDSNDDSNRHPMTDNRHPNQMPSPFDRAGDSKSVTDDSNRHPSSEMPSPFETYALQDLQASGDSNDGNDGIFPKLSTLLPVDSHEDGSELLSCDGLDGIDPSEVIDCDDF